MSLTVEERKVIVGLEMEKAHETFEEIGILTAANRWNGAASRLYYAVFHAVDALLIHDAHAVNTHKGSHAIFNLYYIKTGLLPEEFGRLYNQLQTMREESDYNCAFNVEPEILQKNIEPARRLINAIDELIKGK